MSSRVYVDTRTQQLTMCQELINQAISSLAAQKSQISCGHADVVKSSLDVKKPASVIESARYQDTVEVKATGDLENKLKAGVADYSAIHLGDWKPAPGAETVHIEDGEVESHNNMKLVEDLECAALDGARMMIFEVDDGLGNKSYTVGLEDILFDETGEWKNSKAKSAYENFLTKAMAAQKTALAEDADKFGAQSAKMRSAFRAAGLDAKGGEKLPTGSSHTVFTNTEAREERKPAQTFKVGGRAS
ncbi:MAG: hypothetical protein HY791_19105 [Deltaproteobacteria bacterium]|nr:hypothetical protein [Deltaproteobacteria bacterium]